MKIKVHWLAVQPTPYNKYLYDSFKKSKKFDFFLYYAQGRYKDLPFEEQLTDSEDQFISRKLFFDFILISKLLKKENIVVSAGWNNPTKFVILFLRALFKYPYAIWTDSINPNNYKGRFLIRNYLKSFLLNRSTVVFTTGEFGVAKMKSVNLIKKTQKIKSLPFFVPLPAKYKAKCNYSGELEILSLSRLIPRKGLDIAIRAVKILIENGESVKLYIGGVGPLEEKLKLLIKELNIQNNVILLGWLNKEQLIKYREKCDFFLHPVNQHDPYPLAVLESLANGLPVIGTSLAGSIVDRIKDGYNGFVIDPDSPEAIVEVVEKIIHSSTMIDAMVKNSRISAKKWQVSMASSIVYNELKNMK